MKSLWEPVSNTSSMNPFNISENLDIKIQSEFQTSWQGQKSIPTDLCTRLQIRKSLSKKSCKAISSRYITSYMATWGQSQFAFFWERKRNIKLFCTHAKSLQVKNNKSLCYLSAPGRNNKLLDINGFKPPSY